MKGIKKSKTIPSGIANIDTYILQDRINHWSECGRIRLESGIWRINKPITIENSDDDASPIIEGMGLRNTILVNEIPEGGALFNIKQTCKSEFNYGVVMRDFSIVGNWDGVTKLLPEPSRRTAGIKLSGQRFASFERLNFENLEGDAIYVEYATGEDPTISANVNLHMMRAIRCGGFGLRLGCDSGPLPFFTIDNCWFEDCYGAIHGGLIGRILGSLFAYSRGAAQIVLTTSIAQSRAVVIENNSFEGGDKGELWIMRAYNVRVISNHFTCVYMSGRVPAKSFGVRVGTEPGEGETFNVQCEGNVFSVSGTAKILKGLKEYVAYDIGQTAKITSITDTMWRVWDNKHIKYKVPDEGFASKVGEIVEWGSVRYTKPLQTHLDKCAGNYTIDLGNGARHRIEIESVDADGNLLINISCVGVPDGRMILLHIGNTMNTAVTPSWEDGKFKIQETPPIQPSQWASIWLIFDYRSGRWWQASQWISF
jgi:hypothetical protein